MQEIYCDKCGKYLFTEIFLKHGYKRKDDKENYIYNENQDEFICNDCFANKDRYRLNFMVFDTDVELWVSAYAFFNTIDEVEEFVGNGDENTKPEHISPEVLYYNNKPVSID